MYRKRAALFVVSILLLGALFFSIDYGEFFRIAGKMSWEWAAALLAVQALIILLNALKWYVLIRRYGVSFMNVFQTTLIAMMVNNVSPANLAGGEAIRAYVISKIDRIKLEKAFATVLADLFLAILPILFLMLLSIFLIIKLSLDLRIAWALAIAGVFIAALIISSFSIILNRGPSLRLFNALMHSVGRIGMLKKQLLRFENQVDDMFMSFHRSIKSTMADTPTLILGLTISVAVWALTIARAYFIFVALGIAIEPDVLILVYVLLILVGILPLLPGALGVWEWAGAGMFVFFGIPMAAATAVIVVDRILFYWIPIFTGFLASLHLGINVMTMMDKAD